jgi:hypothetical protein
MPSIHQALEQIDHIRAAFSRSRLFRGYRSGSAIGTAIIAITAAMVQYAWVVDPVDDLAEYMIVWAAAAVLSLALVVGRSMLLLRQDGGVVQRELMIKVLAQLAPALVSGLLVTLAIAMFHANYAGLLPGLWMMLFSLGIFATRAHLPKWILVVAGFYLLAGLITMTLTPVNAMKPAVMGSAFAIGQLLAAAVLHLSLERKP